MTNPSPIGILGAGGQAREVADFAHSRVVFFAVDQDFLPTPGATEIGGAPVIALSGASNVASVPVVAAVGAPGARRGIVLRWSGSLFAQAVSSAAYIASDVRLSPGAMIAPAAVLMSGAVVGEHALVNAGATVGHDTIIAEYGTISPGVHIGGRCVIGAGAFVGIGATVLQGVRIGEGAVIGAGAVVRHDVPAFEVHAGVPSRFLRAEKGWLDAL